MLKLSDALGAAVVTATLLTRTALAVAADTTPAASCVSGDAAVTVVPGEIVSPRERDARAGWLALTYIGDARTALGDRRVRDAVEMMAQARRLLRASDTCARLARDDTAPADRAASNLTSAEAALATGDHEGAARDLADAENALHPWVVGLDTMLFPGSNASR